ncbi:MAG: DUF1109 domain-containing protein [Hyphomicrobium sp.]|uniref:DUF1109 domain-containing protein n=1 Tax=Hyphomicrobium sp. TaxID=82 RepID=UPI0025C43E0F|nr:DUF1109 domain-containing protein [Hyphomicrobium sp.]MBX9865259.1 DUF1109 domain-containing protein [Hyphomicrobium sp.]
MKTDELITMLSTNVEAVDRRRVVREIGATIAIGSLAAVGTMVLALGLRGDLPQTGPLIFLLAKLAFAVGIVVLASVYLMKLARPGGEGRVAITWAALPFVATMLLAVISLAFAPTSHWNRMIMGDQWLECLISIPIIAVVPFAAVIWVLRRMAPTDLIRTGALAGLVAGGLSAIGYALHCTDDSLPFVAFWYGGTIVLCTLAGATLGPRLLRW